MKELIKEYVELAITNNWSASFAANQLLRNNKVNLSHRTLRRKISEGINKINNIKTMEKVSIVEEESGRELNYTGETSLTSKEEAIKFFKIDLNKEEVYKSIFNSWDVILKNKDGDSVKRTNYQVKLFVRPKENKKEQYEKLKYEIDLFDYKKYDNFNNNSTGIGVVLISDIHIGADTNFSKGLINTKSFDLNILQQYLARIAADINNQNKKEIHVALLADFWESISGINHINSWQELSLYGGGAIIAGHKIISNFLHSIKNVKKVYMVSGNHDRIQANKELDPLGSGAAVLAYMLSKEFDVVYKPLIVSQIIDNISYIFTHGHYGISKQAISKIILDYGNQNYYNVVCQGHLHSRQSKKEFYRQEYTHMDSVNYRAITVAPVFTGNFYAESNGWTSAAGYSFITANHNKTNINHLDVSI